MKIHTLHSWKRYLSKSDFKKLLHYVENAKNGLVNKKMLMFSGSGKNGKTTLLNEILFYLNMEKCYEYDISEDDFFDNIDKKNIIIHGGVEKVNKNLIQDMMENDMNIFCDTSFLDFVDPDILPQTTIINMKHVF
jgi:hypothetical protein